MIPIRREWSAMKRLALLSPALAAPAVEDTATGNPLTFQTDLARPLKSLLIPFTPIQSGTGDPSPENIRSILPWNGLKVWNGGKNLLPDSAVSYGSWGTDGSEIQNDNNKYRRLSVNLPAGTYVFSTDTTNCYIIRLLIDDTVVGTGGEIQSKNFTLTAPANVKIVWRNTDTSEITGTLHNQIEAGQTATAYEPYKPITKTDISFPSPVYGGTLDVVTGEVWATWFVHNFLWSDKWYGSELTNVERRAFKLPNGVIPHTMSYYNDHKAEIKCNIAPLLWSYTIDSTHYYVDKDGDYYRALVFLPIGTSEDTQIQVGGTLADPVLITTLTPEQITALVGDNTIWSDADGSMTAVYLKKK